jgi:hypothetical protein
MKKEKAERFLIELSEYRKEDKCRECECLQGALVQLRLDFPELMKEAEKFTTTRFHKCLGCTPCPPSEVWAEYLKEG